MFKQQVLDDLECAEIIAYFKQNKHKAKKWLTAYHVRLDVNDPWIKSIVDDIVIQAQAFKPSVVFQYGFVVMWPPGANQWWHTDDNVTFTSITYLNDDFVGGHTEIDTGDVGVPATGTTIYFNGLEHSHRVTPVESGTRYTIAIWYEDAQ